MNLNTSLERLLGSYEEKKRVPSSVQTRCQYVNPFYRSWLPVDATVHSISVALLQVTSLTSVLTIAARKKMSTIYIHSTTITWQQSRLMRCLHCNAGITNMFDEHAFETRTSNMFVIQVSRTCMGGAYGWVLCPGYDVMMTSFPHNFCIKMSDNTLLLAAAVIIIRRIARSRCALFM